MTLIGIKKYDIFKEFVIRYNCSQYKRFVFRLQYLCGEEVSSYVLMALYQ